MAGRGWRALRACLAVAGAGIIGVGTAALLIGHFGRRLNRSAAYRRARTAFNRVMFHWAGRKGSAFALLHHKGRSSGRWHTTPVALLPLRSAKGIPATYGTDADWCRNILASGSCLFTWQGELLAGEDARMLSLREVLRLLPVWQQPVYRLVGIQQFMLVTPRPALPIERALVVPA